VSATLDPEVLRYELAVRGLSQRDLAKLAGFCPATASAAKAGRPISVFTIERIAEVLVKTPVNEVIARLLPPGGQGIEGRPAKPAPVDRQSQEADRICPLGGHCGLRGMSAASIAS
jgi:transcriptional regulator with XRE-family HTH domain